MKENFKKKTADLLKTGPDNKLYDNIFSNQIYETYKVWNLHWNNYVNLI